MKQFEQFGELQIASLLNAQFDHEAKSFEQQDPAMSPIFAFHDLNRA